MSLIDLKNLEKLTPEQKSQFNALLEQFPHLESKMETARELNTPTKMDEARYVTPTPASQVNDEVDYANFSITSPLQEAQPESTNKDLLPKMKVNALESSFSSFETETEERKPSPREAQEMEEKRREHVRQQQIKSGVDAGQSYAVASFSPEGKVHPVLQKLRATLGMRSVQKPVEVNVGGCIYGMKALDRMSLANATLLAITTTTANALYESNLESSIVAFSVVHIDGVPLYDIFSIPTEDGPIGEVASPLTREQREQKAAEAFYIELLKNPNELTEALGIHYQQEFPPLNLLGAGKAKFLCPVENCIQSRIADYDTICYCPVHGAQMARETDLPNPS
jgi:hypothetical protein